MNQPNPNQRPDGAPSPEQIEVEILKAMPAGVQEQIGQVADVVDRIRRGELAPGPKEMKALMKQIASLGELVQGAGGGALAHSKNVFGALAEAAPKVATEGAKIGGLVVLGRIARKGPISPMVNMWRIGMAAILLKGVAKDAGLDSVSDFIDNVRDEMDPKGAVKRAETARKKAGEEEAKAQKKAEDAAKGQPNPIVKRAA